MQIDVRQRRGNDGPNAKGNFRLPVLLLSGFDGSEPPSDAPVIGME